MVKKYIFPDLIGFESQTLFMQKCMLLEFIMIKNVLDDKYTVPLKDILNKAGLNQKNCNNLCHILQAIAYNNVVFLAHQGLHSSSIFLEIDHPLTLDCYPSHINKWAANAGQNKIYAFNKLPNDILNNMRSELEEKINLMKKIIAI